MLHSRGNLEKGKAMLKRWKRISPDTRHDICVGVGTLGFAVFAVVATVLSQ